MSKILTKNDVKQLINAQTKQLNLRIDPIEKLLKQNTEILRQTTALVTHLVQDAEELKSEMKEVKAAVESHTEILDSISKNTENQTAETSAIKNTLSRHEQWFFQLAKKIRVKLEGLT